MKAVLSNRIFMVASDQLVKKLEKELTYEIPQYGSEDQFLKIKNLRIINHDLGQGNKLVSFPIGRTDLIPSNYEISDKRAYEEIDFPEFKPELRPSQAEIVNDIDDNCIINAQPGFGKSFTALALAAKLKQKTLIIVHTVALRNQWEKEIFKTLGIKPGVIGSGKFNTDSPIVVANVQSIVKKVNQLSRMFGLLLVDEMQHSSSSTFSQIIDGLFSRFKVGLSGTIERKDQKHVVFKDYFSSKIYRPSKENIMDPKVHVIVSGLRFPDGYELTWADKVTGLTQSSRYQELIVRLADYYARIGHKVLVVSDRVDFLKHCHQTSKSPSALFIGETVDRDKVIEGVYSGEIQQVYGSQNMVSEGISINPLSVIILATPVNNMPLLEQLIGRINRQHPNKLSPIVVDIKLEGNTVTKQLNNRIGHYMKEDYSIEFVK